jgi:UDP-glucuronate 4-epimerase
MAFSGKKILITGASGTVARPCAEYLAKDNEVWCIGRFGNAEARESLEKLGIKIRFWDLGVSSMEGIPDDFTHAMHAAILVNPGDFPTQIERNGYATAQLMTHCKNAEAFLYVSSSCVYKLNEPEHRHKEDDAVGGEAPYLPAYPAEKSGCEAITMALSRVLNLKSIIARSSVTHGPYGFGGLPARYYETLKAGKSVAVSKTRENWCMLMHTNDAAREIPILWGAATVPCTVVNWGGNDAVSQRQIVEYVAEITGLPAKFEQSDVNFVSHAYDNTRRDKLIGECKIGWKEGIRKALEARFPGSVKH